jgi:hypothetical protein
VDRAPRKLWVKASAIGAAAMFMLVAYAGLADLLGRPKPVSLEIAQRQAQEAIVLGTQVRGGRGIYLWLQLPEVKEPRAYALPWERMLAQQLLSAGREAERNGSDLRARLPFTRSRDRNEAMFYAPPQQAPPPKTPPGQAPLVYAHPQGGA